MSDQESGYHSGVVDTIFNMFGDVVTKEVINAVVESFAGDLNQSVEAVMNMAMDSNTTQPSTQMTPPSTGTTPPLTQENGMQKFNSAPQTAIPTVSYAGASITTKPPNSPRVRSTGAIPKTAKLNRTPHKVNNWTPQIQQIIKYHNEGSRTLILMRGLSGSGKSYLAREIIEMTVGPTGNWYARHIFSTDDYFMRRGVYKHDKYMLSEAHCWNQNRVRQALIQGISPVIVDNTNIEIWEMNPYCVFGVNNGYIIEVVEPNTPWAKNLNQLARRNIHNVPIETLRRKLENYQSGISGHDLIKSFKLSYPPNLHPPVPRLIPVIESRITELSPSVTSENEKGADVNVDGNLLEALINIDVQPVESGDIENQETNVASQVKVTENLIDIDSIKTEPEMKENQIQQYSEIEKRIEEFAKIEQEWEEGESWQNDIQEEAKVSNTNYVYESKPPRKNRNGETTLPSSIMETVNICEDWRKMSMFMPPWANSLSPPIVAVETVKEKKDSCTAIELGDTDLNNEFKVVTAIPRDINLLHIQPDRERIPERRMLDKSSMTNEAFSQEAFRCKNEEKHFLTFRKMFKNLDRASLRDIFEKCFGDVNWAVDIVLDSMANKQIEITDSDDLSDSDVTNMEQCECLAAYNIIPDTSTDLATINDNQSNETELSSEATFQQSRKIKKDKILSESSIQLKRQIEQNFVIAENHYSQHCLKIRKMRRGENESESQLDRPALSESKTNINQNDSKLSSPEQSDARLTTQNQEEDDSDTDSSNESVGYVEKTVNITLGKEFLSQLDELFGRRSMSYPDFIVPKINIPLSTLSEINALWMESLMYQMDRQSEQSHIMVQQDEDFARLLALKEEELAQAGIEPEVPDFKEIMDMDIALSIYQRDVTEWKNNEPNDLAARMTREKLYNLFPDLSQEILSELLMAHDNNFKNTVEVLLMSTGRTDILQDENGINKFVMEKEMEKKQKILEEQNKTLSDSEWPFLPQGQDIKLSDVEVYRKEAETHLDRRNRSYQKAQDYIRRGMTPVANYYSDIASFHKRKYEQCSSLAAAALMQLHAAKGNNNCTIDLHYLRVAEAKESLDLFIDNQIQNLKEAQERGGPRCQNLFLVTGRGLHSVGGPKIKPAVKRRLRERGLHYGECNPGLLSTRVSVDDKLTYQLT